jgi:hypothetical protein
MEEIVLKCFFLRHRVCLALRNCDDVREAAMHRGLLIACLCALAWVYVTYYARAKNEYQVLQVTADKLTFELLNERLPIVVETGGTNTDVTHETIVAKAFKFLYVTKKSSVLGQSNAFHQVTASYGLFYVPAGSTGQQVEVEVIMPKYVSSDDFQSIAVVLHPADTVLILPRKWAIRFNLNPDRPEDDSVHMTLLYGVDSILNNALGI